MSLPTLTVPVSEQTSYPSVLVPAGTHFARIYKIVDLGTQKQEFKGEAKPDARIFSISFEFPKIKHVFKEDKGEQPLSRSKDVKFAFTSKESANRSILTDLVEATGDNPYEGNYNIFSLLGKTLQVSIEEYTNDKGQTKDKIAGFSKLSSEQLEMVEMKPAIYAQVNPSKFLYLDPQYFDGAFFESLPDFQKDKIRLSPEFANLKQPKVETKEIVNDLPEVSDQEVDELVSNVQMPM